VQTVFGFIEYRFELIASIASSVDFPCPLWAKRCITVHFGPCTLYKRIVCFLVGFEDYAPASASDSCQYLARNDAIVKHIAPPSTSATYRR